jgi:mxaD protein
MKKIFAVLFASLLPLVAFAHGPSPQKVVETVTIKAPPAKVWALVSDFNGMPKWHPAIKASKVEKKGADTFRTLTLKEGGTINERLKGKNDADMRLKYEIVEGVLPVSDYYATITVKPGANANESTVEWMARFYRKYKLNPPIPAGQDDESAIKAVNGVIKPGLANLKKVAESGK